MCRNSIITLVMLLLILGLINLPGSTGLVVCFSKHETCQPSTFSCTQGIIRQISAKVYDDSNSGRKCSGDCVVNHSTSGTVSGIADHCIGDSTCSITHDTGVSNGGIIDINFTCAVSTNTLHPTASPPTPSISESNTKLSTEGTSSSTDPDIMSSAKASTNILNPTASPPTPSIPDSNTKPSTKGTLSSMDPDVSSYGQASKNTLNLTASPRTPSISESNTKPSTERTPSSTDLTSSAQVTIVVSVVAPITTVVVVVSIMMYRRGHCKLLVGICTKRCGKHSADRADAYALSSTANANPTYNFSNDVRLNGCDVDYTEIDKIIKEPNVEYNHLNLIKKEAVHEPTYNHIGHFNSSSGNTEQTYDHVGNETLQKTDLSTLQQDTYMYSHIGALAKPASEQVVEDSYAHINGVMKDPSTFDETNQYDVASFHLNVGPAGDFGNQDMKSSSKEREFTVVDPSKVDSNNEAPVSHSYFILEKHEK